jgi:hypothetical protein
MTLVVKADGTKEQFKVNKLKSSLRKAGASKREIQDIISRIDVELYEGIKTEEIYRRAFELLRTSEQPIAARYSLRRALFNLGPTGFPFEDFLARLFKTEGYKTRTRIELKGSCATHEVDVIAYKPEGCLLVEAKFHARPGIKSDLQVALYSYARFMDLQNKKATKSQTCGITHSIIATNTKFTSSAKKYAECSGIELLSWDYPKGNNLQDRIENAGIYPITVLTSLSLKHKQSLIKQGYILCRDIIDNRTILRSIGCSQKKTEHVLEEVKNLCSSHK